ncbi:hemoblobin-interacting domain-containing protein [Anoxynatronum buryatiense]|uniref:Heme-binding protein Shr-like Hb-interacting domain-containing protein n=1 Tax=Anoxynatronum buryatiense TaxID=489973 RepID=A0AA45WYX0_9CLOT|nr:hemoblobin-interacting domain-containing protein [Anoxynatronum buryatiense]SMP65633.1 Protein of unknown function [Anoxynatronum buryatiense]
MTAPPTLIPDTTDNTPNYWISIDCSPYDESYANAITVVEVDGIEYGKMEGLEIVFESDGGGIRLNPNQIPPLQVRGAHTIRIKATGYLDATTTQVITADRLFSATTISGPVQGGTYNNGQTLPEIKLQLKDRFGNALIDGPDAGISLTAEIPQGYGGGSNLSGTLSASADADGQVTFNNIVVNLSEGVNQDSLTLKFTGIDIYLTDPGTENWAVFTVVRP